MLLKKRTYLLYAIVQKLTESDRAQQLFGSWLILLAGSIIFTSYSADTQITLSLHDQFGQVLHQPIVGVPFHLDLDLTSGQQQNVNLQQIVNLTNFEHKNNGVVNRLNIINGVTQTHRTYSYLVRVDQPGQYTLGPAELLVNGKLVKSNSVQFQVITDPDNNGVSGVGGSNNHATSTRTNSNASNSNNGLVNGVGELKNAPLFLKLIGPTKPVFVGEKFKVITRIYSNLQQLQLTNLEPVSARNFKISPVQKAQSGTTTIRNLTYSYQDYEQIVTAEQAGEFLLPAVALDYAVPSRRGGWFFMPAYTHQQAYSNSLKITVQDLPAMRTPVATVPSGVNKDRADQALTLIGAFKTLKLTSAQTSLKQGEGGVVQLILTGDLQRPYDLDDLKLEQLELPAGLRAFYSKTSRLAPDQSQFDFVLQGLQAGEFTIPAQKLRFFNPVTAKYQELSSAPVKLVVAGDTQQSGVNSPPATSHSLINTTNALNTPDCDAQQIDHELNPIICNLNLNSGRKLLIPQTWFLSLTILLLLILLGLGGYLGYGAYTRRASYIRRQAFKQAQRGLNQAETVPQIYQIFLNLGHQVGVNNWSDSVLLCSAKPGRVTISTTKWTSWCTFWEKLVHASFDPQPVSLGELRKLNSSAQAWLKFWREQLCCK